MRRSEIVIAALVLSASLYGCRTTEQIPARNTFAFTYEGETYEIVSLVGHMDEGYNVLLLLRDGKIVVRARDREQDGLLDTVLVGSVSLAHANAIYLRGIETARLKGAYEEHPYARTFELARPGWRYVVQSFPAEGGGWFNKLIVCASPSHVREILLDTNADGTLDRVEQGAGDLQHGQHYYELALADGVRTGRIEKAAQRFVVRARQ